jgi:parallel beta-helix repeat protein
MRKLGLLLIFILVTIIPMPFMVHTSMAISTIYIKADGSIDPPSAPILTTDNMVYSFVGDIYDQIVVEKNDIVIDGTSHTVKGSKTGNGFTLYSVTNITLTNINIKDFAYGIYLESSSYNSIYRNNVSGNDYDGIEVYFSSDFNNITENTIEGNGWFGVGIHYSNNNTLSGNRIINNDDGMDLYDASGTIISNNRITGCGEFGIGLYLSSDNSIFLNCFANNTQHIYSESVTNNWDNGYPSGGNYWESNEGKDEERGPNQDETGSDGIFDTTYTIDTNNIDRYPLTKPYRGSSDIGLASFTCSKTAIPENNNANISAKMINFGFSTETTHLTLRLNATILYETDTSITSRNSNAFTFTLNTTSIAKARYSLETHVNPVTNETDTTDNTRTLYISVTFPGDVNGDLTVDIYDAIALAAAYDSVPQTPSWNPNADINSDNIVDIYDAIFVSSTYGKKI